MTILNSADAILRARAAMGRDDRAGACLANVYAWFGSVQSVGPGAGKFARAIDAWNYAVHRPGPTPAPAAGLPVYFGTDTPRRDRNAGAGDVTLSIGGGFVIATDSPNGTPGIMSIPARARQTQRNYLGPAYDFLGHDTTAGLAVMGIGPSPVRVAVNPPIPAIERNPMILLNVWSTPKDKWHGDIVAVDGLSAVVHLDDPADVQSIARTEGLFKPEVQATDAAVRGAIADLGTQVTPAQFIKRVHRIRQAGGYVDPRYSSIN